MKIDIYYHNFHIYCKIICYHNIQKDWFSNDFEILNFQVKLLQWRIKDQ